MIQPSLKTIRVIIADDHVLLREGFQNMLRAYSEIEFVGAAENGQELIAMVQSLHPDIVFTDINMPLMDGIVACRTISRDFSDTAVIALTMYDDDHLVIDMLEAGAKGYLVKNASKQEIIEAIHSVYDGGVYYCKHTSAKLTRMIGASQFNPYKMTAVPEFNEKEREVIRLVCLEHSNKEIAAIMNLSQRTVEGYREKLQEKMNVKNTAGMVVYAMKKGLFIY
ncbi:MAG: response regulator transcription factor [Chitinophagaceae bacterium]